MSKQPEPEEFLRNLNFRKCAKTAKEICEEAMGLFLNIDHDKKIHTFILSLFSKSVALAPKNSEELAEAYFNRSTLLIHLKKYQECIIDIDRSLQISIIINNQKLQKKIIIFKEECLQIFNKANEINKTNFVHTQNEKSHFKKDILKMLNIDDINFQNSLGENINKKLELPSIEPSEEVPCAANCVSIRNNEKYGKHLIANQDIAPGQIIIAEESFCVFPGSYKLYLVCSYCLSYAWNGIPCDSCAFAIYCSEDCKIKALQEYHDIECSLVPHYYEFHGEDKIISSHKAAIRLFIKLLKSEGFEKISEEVTLKQNDFGFFKNSFSCHQFWCCYNLTSHCSEIDLANREKNSSFASIIVELLEKYTNIYKGQKLSKKLTSGSQQDNLLSFSSFILVRLKNMLQVNSYYFQDENCDCYQDCDPCCQKRGIIFAVCSSLLNHSCNPNIGTMFVEKRKIVQYALKPIKKGEQLFANYGTTLSMCVEDRKDFLLKDYYFSCDCEPCSENWPVFNDTIYRKLIPQINNEEILKKYLSFCNGGICPLLHPPTRWHYNEKTFLHAVKMIEIMFNSCNEQFAAVITSINYVTYIVKFFKKIYGLEYNMPSKC